MASNKSKQYAQQNAWKQKNMVRVAVDLSKIADADVIAHLEKQESKRGYIVALIRADMQRQEQHPTQNGREAV